VQFAYQKTPFPQFADITAARESTGGVMDDHFNELDAIKDALKSLTFGGINVIVQDGVIIQIDRTEKRRLRRKPGKRISGQEPEITDPA